MSCTEANVSELRDNAVGAFIDSQLEAIQEQVKEEKDAFHSQVFDYLKANSVAPQFYEAWQLLNERLFEGKQRPIYVGVGLSNYGRYCGWSQGTDSIMLQPHVAESEWVGTLIHEMCHQQDTQEELEYEMPKGFCKGDIHNSQAWCDRINFVMALCGDRRLAFPHKRHHNEMVPVWFDPEAGKEGKWVEVERDSLPSDYAVIDWRELKSWELAPKAQRELLPEFAANCD